MAAYNYFAQIYDSLTENVNYQFRSDYIETLLNRNHIHCGTLIDLACGTGSMSVLMAQKGFKIIGIDNSCDMLSVADSKSKGKVLYIHAQMQNFALEEPADACMCNLDSINHLNNINDVKDTFKCVFNALKKDGIFVFDVNTVYKHNNILAGNTFVFDEDDYFLSWDNELYDSGTVRIMLDIFAFNGKNYDRYSEEFFERAYEISELEAALNPYFNVVGLYDDLTLNKPKTSSERLYFVCRRK